MATIPPEAFKDIKKYEVFKAYAYKDEYGNITWKDHINSLYDRAPEFDITETLEEGNCFSDN